MLFLHSLKSHAPLIAIMMPLLVLAAHDAGRGMHDTGLGMAAAASLAIGVDINLTAPKVQVQEQKEDMPGLMSDDESDSDSPPSKHHKRKRSTCMLPETPVTRKRIKRKESKKQRKRRLRAEEQARLDAMEGDAPKKKISKKAKAEQFRQKQAGGRRKGKKYNRSNLRDLRTLDKGVQKAIRNGSYHGQGRVESAPQDSDANGHKSYWVDDQIHVILSNSGPHRDSDMGWLSAHLENAENMIIDLRAELMQAGYPATEIRYKRIDCQKIDTFRVDGVSLTIKDSSRLSGSALNGPDYPAMVAQILKGKKRRLLVRLLARADC